MTSAKSVIERIEMAGGVLALDGHRIRCRLPEDKADLLDELRTHKEAVVILLREREVIPAIPPAPAAQPEWPAGRPREPGWPSASLDAERRFRQPHARLFPFIGRKVRTPGGPGTLVQVSAERVTVLLDSDLGRCARFHPQEVEPASAE